MAMQPVVPIFIYHPAQRSYAAAVAELFRAQRVNAVVCETKRDNYEMLIRQAVANGMRHAIILKPYHEREQTVSFRAIRLDGECPGVANIPVVDAVNFVVSERDGLLDLPSAKRARVSPFGSAGAADCMAPPPYHLVARPSLQRTPQLHAINHSPRDTLLPMQELPLPSTYTTLIGAESTGVAAARFASDNTTGFAAPTSAEAIPALLSFAAQRQSTSGFVSLATGGQRVKPLLRPVSSLAPVLAQHQQHQQQHQRQQQGESKKSLQAHQLLSRLQSKTQSGTSGEISLLKKEPSKSSLYSTRNITDAIDTSIDTPEERHHVINLLEELVTALDSGDADSKPILPIPPRLRSAMPTPPEATKSSYQTGAARRVAQPRTSSGTGLSVPASGKKPATSSKLMGILQKLKKS
eukprot:NODE_1734_length_1423_cov_30.747453_g1564_i0.p1 GENE.NODE_1734_length_1423_cov_30.747453_g1564_i0~~NODE_1734_length_1423_cov_30.747453_g1564_i0.p1  ORF type:complete len:409 (+),score=67.88 NODE_1734_length_1423_cov_30.747453_g1564_i0:144-1370(+)